MSSAVIYTDLDGTLLDHHTYAFDEALEIIKALSEQSLNYSLSKLMTLILILSSLAQRS